ncbi:hypothetical protein COU80_04870 [Candidatus Peregrinibacteria bacterium CG10_big_fil_rev_8_21_14_0_10_55_24]|nr:MAG: hypothetical protein COU80_04870 [Candidatus Peregrinibacteria bacterium CG10_big_fil_rev_8_21_14_0_10_55_24]
MRTFHLSSFLVGVAGGVLILLIFFGGRSLFSSPQNGARGALPMQERSADSGPPEGGFLDENRLGRIADQMGMTVEELQAEMDAGKTIPEIAQERGVELGGGMRTGSGGGMRLQGTASGAAVGTGSAIPPPPDGPPPAALQ